MNHQPHLEESLKRDMELIRSKVLEMGSLCERAVKAALQAFQGRDRQLAYSVILRDQYLDELETELDRLCLEFLVRQQPAGANLRFVFTAIKINKELERIGDYAESVARQALLLHTLVATPAEAKFQELGNLAIHMLHDAVHAFLEQDAVLARRTMQIEERANSLRNEINAALAGEHQAGKVSTEAFTPLLTIARRFERVTDQTKNICEEVLYLCTGEFIRHPGAEAFRILFIDQDNRCLSQMAEAVGNAMAIPRFVFSSAGIAPLPVDPRLATFLAKKGIDVSRHTSKTCEQVPLSEYYQVIVALDQEARKAFPSPPTKTVCLTWPIPNPAGNQGTSEEVDAAFESAFRLLDSHIRDLVEAIRGEPTQKGAL